MTFAYLASPYSPVGITDREHAWRIREERFQAACKAAAALMRKGAVVFCPIAMSHPVESYFDAPQDGEFWKRQDEPYLTMCTELVVLMLPGWEQSSGVRHEVEVAQFRGIPINYMEAV